MDAVLTDHAGPAAAHTVTVMIGDSPSDLVLVRQRVRELLAGYPALIIVDVVCVADALATNAYGHGQAPQVVRATVAADGVGLRIEADDAAVFALPVVYGWSGITVWACCWSAGWPHPGVWNATPTAKPSGPTWTWSLHPATDPPPQHNPLRGGLPPRSAVWFTDPAVTTVNHPGAATAVSPMVTPATW